MVSGRVRTAAWTSDLSAGFVVIVVFVVVVGTLARAAVLVLRKVSGDPADLPTSHTCGNLLVLPPASPLGRQEGAHGAGVDGCVGAALVGEAPPEDRPARPSEADLHAKLDTVLAFAGREMMIM